MKFLFFILVIIDNLNVVLANNDNCGLNDLNALMVRLRQLKTDFNALKTQHEATQAEIRVLKEANRKQETANRKQETELEELRQDVNNKSLEIAAISQDLEMIKAKCPALWNFFKGSCYYNTNERRNWLEAENSCIDLGGHLVEITSEEENNFIWSIIRNHAWIGLNDSVTEGVYVWVSSGNNASGVYEKWTSGQTNNSAEDCVFMDHSTGEWHDYPCSYAFSYICERESMLA